MIKRRLRLIQLFRSLNSTDDEVEPITGEKDTKFEEAANGLIEIHNLRVTLKKKNA